MNTNETTQPPQVGGSALNNGAYMNMKTVTTTQTYPANSVAGMLETLKQADKNSIVRDDKGRPVSAYIDTISMSIVIVADDV